MLGFREPEGRADEREVREAHEREAGKARAFTDTGSQPPCSREFRSRSTEKRRGSICQPPGARRPASRRRGSRNRASSRRARLSALFGRDARPKLK